MQKDRIFVNEAGIETSITTVLEARQYSELLFSENLIAPEAQFVNQLKELEPIINNPDFAANALFLTTTFIRGGNTSDFFNSIYSRNNLSEYYWIFIPQTVIHEDPKKVTSAVKSFFGPQGYASDAIPKWIYNCNLLDLYGGITKYFDTFGKDAEVIAKALYVKNRAKTNKKVEAGAFLGFGPKLAHLAIQLLNQYQLYPFKNSEKFGLAIDFQWIRLIMQTEGLILKGDENVNEISYNILLPLITKLAIKNDWHLGLVQETLWLLGHYGCNEERHDVCPIRNKCKGLMRSTRYQRLGVLSSKDIVPFKKD